MMKKTIVADVVVSDDVTTGRSNGRGYVDGARSPAPFVAACQVSCGCVPSFCIGDSAVRRWGAVASSIQSCWASTMTVSIPCTVQVLRYVTTYPSFVCITEWEFGHSILLLASVSRRRLFVRLSKPLDRWWRIELVRASLHVVCAHLTQIVLQLEID